jgi:hypothetical protein
MKEGISGAIKETNVTNTNEVRFSITNNINLFLGLSSKIRLFFSHMILT